MHDFEAFSKALQEHGSQRGGDGEPSYMDSLMSSMSLVLDEFYNHLTVSCSCFLMSDERQHLNGVNTDERARLT